MKQITSYMAETGLTHQAMADMIGISRPFFTQIVNQTRFPSRKVIHRIAEVTNGRVPPTVWFEDEPKVANVTARDFTAPEFLDYPKSKGGKYILTPPSDANRPTPPEVTTHGPAQVEEEIEP